MNFKNMEIAEKYGRERKVLLHWKAPEFEVYEGDKKLHAYIYLILIAIIGYAVYRNSLVMAITFILIGVIIYLQQQKEPRTIDFYITDKGVVAGNEIFEYENIKSFWVFYEPPYEKYLSLHTRGQFVPFIHIALGDQSPAEIHEILSEYIPEIKQEPKIVDALERFLRI